MKPKQRTLRSFRARINTTNLRVPVDTPELDSDKIPLERHDEIRAVFGSLGAGWHCRLERLLQRVLHAGHAGSVYAQ